jgi:hypothetical protein
MKSIRDELVLVSAAEEKIRVRPGGQRALEQEAFLFTKTVWLGSLSWLKTATDFERRRI